jgi:hypothetical protein
MAAEDRFIIAFGDFLDTQPGAGNRYRGRKVLRCQVQFYGIIYAIGRNVIEPF